MYNNIKKKRILVFFIFGVFLTVYFSINVTACHDGTPDECTPGQSEFGGNCGSCGGVMRRDCDSGGAWGGWFCQNNVPPNYGQSCNCGACGCGGTIQCDGSCGIVVGGTTEVIVTEQWSCPSIPGTCSASNTCTSGYTSAGCLRSNVPAPNYDDIYCSCYTEGASCGTVTRKCVSSGIILPTPDPTPSNYGQACGNCGTIGCSGSCDNQGPCSPGQRDCSGQNTRVCSSNCKWEIEQNCNNQDGLYCNADTSEQRDYGCSGGSCTYSVTSSENCVTKASTDTDGSSTAYTTVGTVTDYVTCSGGSCTSNSYPDSCSATELTEYGASGSSFVSNNYECQNYESNYCGGDNRYYRNEWACSGSPGACTDIADTPIGTNSDNDAMDLQCGDSLCDNSPGVFDSTKTPTETTCTDSLDNDCDVLTDCNDNDCDGSIAGTVKNQDDQPVSSADVSAKKDLTTVKSAITNSLGNYTINPINCGTYNLVASHPDYAPQTKSNVVINPQQQSTENFGGSGESGSSLVLGTSCEADCTFAADNIVHASCDSKNGCTFYDSISKAACDNSQPSWVRDYNATHYVTCASGSPQLKIEIEASVSCESGTLVKITRIVVYNGKPVKLVVAVCG